MGFKNIRFTLFYLKKIKYLVSFRILNLIIIDLFLMELVINYLPKMFNDQLPIV